MFPVVVIRQPGQTPIHVQVREAIEVGRECTGVILVDPKVSRRHLVLAPTHTGGAAEVAVLDLGSMNGTLLGGARIDTEVVLRAGAEIRLGETTIALATDPPAPTTAPPVPAAEPDVPTGPEVVDAADVATTVVATPPEPPEPPEPVDRTGPDRTPDESVWQRPADGTPGGSEAEPADPWL